MSAFEELMDFLGPGEYIEGIVFGGYGCSEATELDYAEREGVVDPIPMEERGRVLTIERAAGYMQDWGISGGLGGPDTYAFYAWTARRVIFIAEYDGATSLRSIPRSPEDVVPELV